MVSNPYSFRQDQPLDNVLVTVSAEGFHVFPFPDGLGDHLFAAVDGVGDHHFGLTVRGSALMTGIRRYVDGVGDHPLSSASAGLNGWPNTPGFTPQK